MGFRDNRIYRQEAAENSRRSRPGLGLLLCLCLALGIIMYNQLTPGQREFSGGVGGLGSIDGGQLEQTGYKWPGRVLADSEALFAWRRYQQELAEAAGEIKVAVYCTHSSETYTSYSGQAKVYGELGGVYRGAAALQAALQAEGIGVFVDETIHDWPDWNRAYTNSLATAEGLLAAYPNLQLLIDMHRDAGVSRESSITEIDGKTAARIMLVCGSAQRYDNPNWEKNRDFMERLGNKMEELYPGLLRRVSVQAGRYNQHIFDHAILVELGSTENNIDEVEYSAALLAEAIRQVLVEEK